MLIEVYCDGSSEGNSTGHGGFAYVICVEGVKVHEGNGHLNIATNNTAEIEAAIHGLTYVATTDIPGIDANSSGSGVNIVLISDSQLTLKWATGEFRCKKWHLIPLVIELRKLYQQVGATTRWVKGHNGNEFNERCDVLANEARKDPSTTDSK